MVGKLVMYVVKIRRSQQKFNYSAGFILALREKAVWSDMLAAITIHKTAKKNIRLVLRSLSY